MEHTTVRKPVLSGPPTGGKQPFPVFPLLLLLVALIIGLRYGVQMSRKHIEGTEGHVYLDEDGNPEVIPEIHEKLENHKKKRD